MGGECGEVKARILRLTHPVALSCSTPPPHPSDGITEPFQTFLCIKYRERSRQLALEMQKEKHIDHVLKLAERDKDEDRD